MKIYNFIDILLTSLIFMQSIESKQIFIDPIQGIDEQDCGQSKPCKNLRFAWDTAMVHSSENATDNVTFELYPGVYKPDQKDRQPLFYRCGHESVKSIEIKKFENGTSSPVHVFHSFEVSSCIFKLTGLNLREGGNVTASGAYIHINRCLFKETNSSLHLLQTNILFDDVKFIGLTSTNQILALRSDIIEIRNSVFMSCKMNDPAKTFIEAQSIRTFNLENVIFSKNSGPENSKVLKSGIFFDIKDVMNADMKNITFHKNKNLVFRLQESLSLTGTLLKIEENVNSTLSFCNINGSLNGVFLQSKFTDEDLATISLKESSINLKDVVVSCMGKKMLRQSPISVDKTDDIKCSNCSVSQCKNICGEGFQVIKNVFCEKCPVGTSAHAWEKICKHCHPGYFSPQSGALDCQPCSKGTFCKDKGCSSCRKCKNEMFTSQPGSTSCSQMSLLFIILLGVALLLIMAPVAVKVIKTKRNQVETEEDDIKQEEEVKKSYTKFENDDM